MKQNVLTCRVILLPTKDETNVFLFPNKLLKYQEHKLKSLFKGVSNQHLYFISNEPIKEGDWCVNQQYHNLMQVKSKNQVSNLEDINTFMLKVEATTDASLGLPLIPQSFIKQYVKEQGKIKEVNISFSKLKGETMILFNQPKDSWSREEVIALLEKLGDDLPNEYMENFIKDNL